jgi:predicted methyltransferase
MEAIEKEATKENIDKLYLEIGLLEKSPEEELVINKECAEKLYSFDPTVRKAQIDEMMIKLDDYLMEHQETEIDGIKTHTTTLRSPWSQKLNDALKTAEEINTTVARRW